MNKTMELKLTYIVISLQLLFIPKTTKSFINNFLNKLHSMIEFLIKKRLLKLEVENKKTNLENREFNRTTFKKNYKTSQILNKT